VGHKRARLDVAREKLATVSVSRSASLEVSLAPATAASSSQPPWLTLIFQVLLRLGLPTNASPARAA
jgi:hypothetical protein